MSMNFFSSVKEAISNLNPQDIRNESERKIQIGIISQTDAGYREIERFLLPPSLPSETVEEFGGNIHRVSYQDPSAARYDIEIASPDLGDPGIPASPNTFFFNPEHPESTIEAILEKHGGWSIALGRALPPFRATVASFVVKRISKENALFAVATALPDLIPLLSLPWALGEFASDTAVLTANQIRLAFLLAAVSGRPVGYREQKTEVASIMVGAFGWRALARELVGQIPFGGGLIPKAAIAYAGTLVAGLSLERYYRIGSEFSHEERRLAYKEALEHGKAIAGPLLSAMRQLRQARET